MSKIKCLQCGEILESKFRHDFQMCHCDNQTAVDGGNDYLKICGVNLNLIEIIDEFGPQMVNKDKIDKILNLYNQRNTLIREIKDEVYTIAKQIRSDVENGSLDIDSTYVNIEWDEYWAYGGYAHESLTFPTRCLYDEKYLNEYIDDLRLKEKMKKENEEKAIKAARKREYIRLKEEFENED